MSYVHYQERIELTKGRYIMVIDKLVELQSFLKSYFDEIIFESLIGGINSPNWWQDNGECCVTTAPLEHRIVGIISEANYQFEKDKLIPVPSDEELLKQYTQFCFEKLHLTL